MKLYETTFIINPQTDDATIDAQVKAVSDVITNNGGKIVLDNRIGTRRLAYPIRKLTQGYYANLVFESPIEALPALDIHYRHNEEYLRNLTVLFEGDLDRLLRRHGVIEDEPEEKPEAKPKPEKPAESENGGPVGRRETAAEAAPAEEAATETATAESAAPVEGAAPAEETSEETTVEDDTPKQEGSEA